MDRRIKERHQSIRPVNLRVLGDAERIVEAALQDMSDGGAAMECVQRIDPGTAVRLDLEDNLFLGEAVYCSPLEGENLESVSDSSSASGE